MTKDLPVIIEAAINGETSVARNPHVPRLPDEIGRDASACIKAGASIIHGHIEDIRIHGKAAADRYAEGWAPALRDYPQAIFYPTVVFHDDRETRFGHLHHLVQKGAADMGAYDPGSTNFASKYVDGVPTGDFVYTNSYAEIHFAFSKLSQLGLGASMALYEPGFARAVLAWHKAGKLPKGSFVKFYFGGGADFLTGERGGVSFGLPPTVKALDAYVEMFEGTGLPWAVAVLGGDLMDGDLARATLERGGHLRIGLEDHCGDNTPTNVELVQAAVALCQKVGRPVATPEQTRQILGLPLRARNAA